jgi:hypothetical protein
MHYTFKPEHTEKIEKGSMIEHYSKRDKYEHEPGDPRASSRQDFV